MLIRSVSPSISVFIADEATEQRRNPLPFIICALCVLYAKSSSAAIRTRLAVLLLVAWLPLAAHADPVQQADKAFAEHRYEDAVRLLSPQLATLPGTRRARANLSLGLAYHKNAQLHLALYKAALAAQMEYLQHLAAVSGPQRSRYVDYYLGKALLAADRTDEAIKYFHKFLAHKNIAAEYRDAARADLGLAYHLKHETKKATAIWGKITSKKPLARIALARAYARIDVDRNTLLTMVERAMDEGGNSGTGINAGAFDVYVQSGETDRAAALLAKLDITAPAYRENRNDAEIPFYDVTLAADIAELYRSLALRHLDVAAGDENYHDAANYYMMESDLIFGRENAKTLQAMATTTRLPKALLKTLPLRTAAYGHKLTPAKQWPPLTTDNDAESTAELLSLCVTIDKDCNETQSAAQVLAANQQGPAGRTLNTALGEYLLRHGNIKEALTSLEAARDKSQKNRLEKNDPLLLIGLAEAYRRGKIYDQTLEIYFELAKQYPVMRQIQEAVQGTYAMEQRSAGDVRIF